MTLQELIPILDRSLPLTATALASAFAMAAGGLVLGYLALAVPLHRAYGGDGASAAQLRHELRWSLIVNVLHGALFCGVLVAWRHGAFPRFYVDAGAGGWGWFAASLVLLMLVQDVCFYANHALLHTRPLMRFHVIHHRSRTPTAFAMQTFHPVEAVLHFAFVPVAMWLFPLSPVAIAAYVILFANPTNAFGHLGATPRWWPRALSGRWYAGSAEAHGLHHQRSRGNYGLYLTLWDTLLGTRLSPRSGR